MIEVLLDGYAPQVYRQYAVEPDSNIGWCVIKHDPNRDTGLKNPPDAIPITDSPTAIYKLGHGIPVTRKTWDYLRKTNNDAAWAWLKTSQAMWINLPGDTPREIDIETEKVSAESILGGGNLCRFYKFDGWEGFNRIHLYARPYTFDFSILNPSVDNFYNNMGAYWYPTSIDAAGNVYRVAGGIDPLIPILEYTELWIDKEKVIMLDQKPEYWDIHDVMKLWM